MSDNDARDATIADLRAVLAPLLEQPYVDWSEGEYGRTCRFCLSGEPYRGDPPVHTPDCPVLRDDELLGRKS